MRQHADDNVRMLALRGSSEADVDMVAALQQIQGRQMARRKLPSWAAHEELLFPPHLAMEQCSSEQTAQYKAKIVNGEILASEGLASRGGRDTVFIDLTGGFGVDFCFLAPLFHEAVYVEQQEELCQIARHNIRALGLRHAAVVCDNAADFLRRLDRHVSLFFIDPARRDAHGARTYGIADCSPDVLRLLPQLFTKAEAVMLKLSPMLDWRKTVIDLGTENVRQVHIVSVGGECKELLVVLSRLPSSRSFRLVCVNDDEIFDCSPQHLSTLISQPSPIISQPSPLNPHPSTLIYEPNASVMKAGCFALLCQQFGVSQLSQNSHLFVSKERVPGFPGRGFLIERITTMNKRQLRQALQGISQANITVRNFPLSAVELRKRLKLSDGGNTYILATTLGDGTHILLVCSRLDE